MSPLSPDQPPAHPRSVGVEDARSAMRAAIVASLPGRVMGFETLPLADALGRVLASDVQASADVPARATAAMDGFAFDGSALVAANGTTPLTLRGTLLAGAHEAAAPGAGAGGCVRIMTGATLPAGCDTVVPLELCQLQGGVVHLAPGSVRRGAHVRTRGSDIAAGEMALAAGRVLSVPDLGLLASLGRAEVPVHHRLKVALISTGDELVPAGQPLRAGQVHDSNRVALRAALQQMGFDVIDAGTVRDDPQALEAALRGVVQGAPTGAATRADAVVVSGGVSGGDADHTRAVLARLGQVQLWQVAMRPGRPFAFGELDAGGQRAWLFALPGNPVAALVSLWMLAREPLLLLAGATPTALPLSSVPAAAAIPKRVGRTEFARGVVAPAPGGGWHVQPCADQGASAWRGLSQANALIVLEEARGPVAAGEAVSVCLLEGLA